MRKVDEKKLRQAIENRGLTERKFHSMFGGETRVKAWSKKCSARFMGGVVKALNLKSIDEILVDNKVDKKKEIPFIIEKIMDVVTGEKEEKIHRKPVVEKSK